MSIDILGIKINSYTMSETIEKIVHAIQTKQRIRVITANPEMIYRSIKDQALQHLINTADMVTADGIGVVWASKQLKTPVSERVTGIDLLQELFPYANREQWRIYFLGGKPSIAKLAAAKVKEQYPEIILETEHGYFSAAEEAELIRKINAFQPDLLLVGLGAPRQEYWINDHPELATVSIGVGGSFDSLAGVVKRAPVWIQNLHIEWLYRLLKEPWRWKRQTVLPLFALEVLKQTLK